MRDTYFRTCIDAHILIARSSYRGCIK